MILKPWCCLLALLLVCMAGDAAAKMPTSDRSSQKAPGDPRVFGFWAPPDMDAIISIVTCGEALCARLVRHDYGDVARTDVNNPDPALRARPLEGLAIIEGLRAVRRGAWRGGAFYDPRTGKTYLPKLKLLDNDRIRISGCIAPTLCKGYVWTRVTPQTGNPESRPESRDVFR